MLKLEEKIVRLEKKIVKLSKTPEIGNMNRIMAGIFPWGIQSLLQCQGLPRSPLGFVVSRENSFRNEWPQTQISGAAVPSLFPQFQEIFNPH